MLISIVFMQRTLWCDIIWEAERKVVSLLTKNYNPFLVYCLLLLGSWFLLFETNTNLWTRWIKPLLDIRHFCSNKVIRLVSYTKLERGRRSVSGFCGRCDKGGLIVVGTQTGWVRPVESFMAKREMRGPCSRFSVKLNSMYCEVITLLRFFLKLGWIVLF